MILTSHSDYIELFTLKSTIMKASKMLLLLISTIVAWATQVVQAQVPLPEIVIRSMRFKYLNAAGNKDVAQPVSLLQWKAAQYDVRNSDIYEDDFDTYLVSFYLPAGQILATYDSSGKLLQTAEKYKDISLPRAVVEAVSDRFPNWGITKDVYMVSYFADSGAEKVYKLTLHNGNKRLRVKVNEKGEFL